MLLIGIIAVVLVTVILIVTHKPYNYMAEYTRVKNNIEWIKRTRAYLLEDPSCLCRAFCHTNPDCNTYSDIRSRIPEFTPEFFGIDAKYNSYWWERYLLEPRLAALDKLARLYSGKWWMLVSEK